ncbi:uncharacterized protein LOC125234952 [Leguminivora glycinivorella]|uniref:uncharacterized protein LOC125234952 n=1 Tax=Leguminivora glycinivorella TaxID=1035111 RepID=UPI0020104F70|nr:uncharacterized protein LOC125234952 [Leguminivora glycinivorella]
MIITNACKSTYMSSNLEIMPTLMTSKEIKFLVHGDYRPSNLMHRRHNGKLEIVPLDFQTIRTGHQLSDLLYFVFSGSDEKFQRLYYQRIMEHYYEQLAFALKQLQVDVENVYLS